MYLFISIDAENLRHDPNFNLRLEESTSSHRIVEENGQVVLQLQKRSAYPSTFAYVEDAGNIQLGYGNNSVSDTICQDFLHIELTANTLTITRDDLATLPVYYTLVGNHLLISNQYEFLATKLKNSTPNPSFLIKTLLLESTVHGTPVSEIRPLGEREILRFDTSGLHITYPSSRPWHFSDEVAETDPHKFQSVLEKHMEDLYHTCLYGQSYAFEASGGLDSSTLPQFLVKNVTERPYLATMLLPGGSGASQLRKLQALRVATQLPTMDVAMDESQDFPLSSQILSDTFVPFDTTDAETIGSILKKYISQLQNLGITVLATGNGGDDILENHPSYSRNPDGNLQPYDPIHAPHIPAYVTQLCMDTYRQLIEEEKNLPVPLLPLSMQGQCITNNAYIEAGIWPVSPFMNYELFQYCQGLPAYMRHNKNILRAYHQASHYAPEIYNPEKGESSLPFMNEFFMSERFLELTKHFMISGLYEQFDFIDTKKMFSTYDQERNQPTPQGLFQMYQAVATEISLQATPGLVRSKHVL